MKKLISLVAVFAILAATTVCAFADVDVSSKVEGAKLIDTADTYEIVADSNGAYATIVAVKGTTIKVGAIQYINQATTAEGKATFTFALNNDLVKAADDAGIEGDVYVLTGGDGQIRVAGYIDVTEDAPEAPAEFAIAGTVTGFEGATLPTVVVTDGTNSYTAAVLADGSFSVNVPVLTEGSYTLTVAKVGYLTYTKQNIAEAVDSIAATIFAGNVDGNDAVNLTDLSALLSAYGTNVETIEKDFDESGSVNLTDLSALLKNYGVGAIVE